MVILNTCHIRDKAAEKVFSELGRLRALKEARAAAGGRMILAVAGCVAQAEGAEILARAPFVDIVLGPADLSPAAGNGRARGRARGGRGDRHRFPGRGQVRPPARGGARRSGVDRLPDHPGRLRQVLQLLRRALHPRRRAEPPGGRGAGRGAPAGRAGRARDHAARPERERLARRGAGRRAPGASAALLRALAETPGPGAAALHHLAPARHGRRPDRRPSRGAGADAVPAPAGAVRLRPRAGGDEPASTRRTTTGAWSSGCARRGRTSRCRRDFIVGHPGETEADFEATLQLVRDVGFAQAFSFKYSPRPGHAGRRRARPGAGRGEGPPPAGAAGAAARAAGARSTPAASGRRCRCCSPAPAATPARSPAARPICSPCISTGPAQPDRRRSARCRSSPPTPIPCRATLAEERACA